MQGRVYLVGERPTVADFNAAFTLDWAREEALLDDAPALRAFLDRMYARPNAPITIAAAFARMPPELPLQELPAGLAREIPLLQGHRLVKLADRIVVVDPVSRRVVAIIPRYRLLP